MTPLFCCSAVYRGGTRSLRRNTGSSIAQWFSTASTQLKDPRHEALDRDEKQEWAEHGHHVRRSGKPRYREIHDEYATLHDKYSAPKHPIVLAHGLLGFDELRLAGPKFPGLAYWRGIREALAAQGIEVITTAVPASGSLERRAERLGQSIAQEAHGKDVNIIAGLDARYMISRLKPANVNVLSLTTIATPHRGSAFADYTFDAIGPVYLPRLFKILDFFGMETGAFAQLTREFMQSDFNPRTPDLPGVRQVKFRKLLWSLLRSDSYYSYGASLEPTRWSVFWPSHNVIKRLENAPNDGLVSVPSSVWGNYKGTLIGVSHLDLINWTNRLKWYIWELAGSKRNFNAIALYLDICDMLAKEGL